MFIVPAEEMSRETSVVSLALDSLVAVEVRSWAMRETDAAMGRMELLMRSSIVGFADGVMKKNGLREGFWAEPGNEI